MSLLENALRWRLRGTAMMHDVYMPLSTYGMIGAFQIQLHAVKRKFVSEVFYCMFFIMFSV